MAVSAEEVLEMPAVGERGETILWAMAARRYPDTLRADIWIPRPTGGVCRGETLTKRDLMMDIAADFTFSDCRSLQYTAGRVGSILNS